jgi:hypothetical protein
MTVRRRASCRQLHASPPIKPLPVLSFPWEIRNRILRELLFSPTPLRCQDLKVTKQKVFRDHKLHPEILRTCSQLYDEGREVLWGANTIGIDVSLSLQRDQYWSVAGIPQKTSERGKLLLRRVRSIFDETTKLHIFLDLSCYDPLACKWGPDPQHIQIQVGAINKLCERLLRKPNLKDCHIKITATGAIFEKLGSKMKPRNDIMKGFELLRCHTAMVNGVPSNSAVKLATMMMRREPSWDLFRMGAALDQYVREECPCGEYSRNFCHSCASTDSCERRCLALEAIYARVNNCDLAGFLEQRAAILDPISEGRMVDTQRVFEFDQHTAVEVIRKQDDKEGYAIHPREYGDVSIEVVSTGPGSS